LLDSSPHVLDKSALYAVRKSFVLVAALGCHPERSEGSASMGCEILRCAQDDKVGPGCLALAR